MKKRTDKPKTKLAPAKGSAAQKERGFAPAVFQAADPHDPLRMLRRDTFAQRACERGVMR
jgi:hypothetical protein